jgi:hypothetical protein
VRFGTDRVIGRAAVSLAGLCPTEPTELDSELTVEVTLITEPVDNTKTPSKSSSSSTRRGSESFALEAILGSVKPHPSSSGFTANEIKLGGRSAEGVQGIEEEENGLRFHLSSTISCCSRIGRRTLMLASRDRELREETGSGRVRRRARYDEVQKVENREKSEVEVIADFFTLPSILFFGESFLI